MMALRGMCPRSAALATVLMVAACSQKVHTPTAPVVLDVAGHLVKAEVAVTEVEQERGLKNRDSLADDRGMLFVLRRPADVCMWMKDTRIPLSVAFLDDSGTIVNIEEMETNSETRHCSAGPARYVLEVRSGWFSARSILPGRQVLGLTRVGA